MTVGMLLYVLRDVINYLDSHGMILSNGSVDFANLKNDLDFIAHVESSLKMHGADIPEAVDKIMQILPIVLQIDWK